MKFYHFKPKQQFIIPSFSLLFAYGLSEGLRHKSENEGKIIKKKVRIYHFWNTQSMPIHMPTKHVICFDINQIISKGMFFVANNAQHFKKTKTNDA